MRTPVQALRRLRQLATSGDLDRFCREHGVRLLVAFGSAADPARAHAAADLDLAVAFQPGTEPDLLRLLGDLADLVGREGFDIDVMDLDRADAVARQRALVGTVPLFESEPGAFARARLAAMLRYMDTRWLRQLDLQALAR